VARKKTAVVLNKLTRESSIELESMVAELTGNTSTKNIDFAKRSHWSRRFAASGKGTPAPKIRRS